MATSLMWIFEKVSLKITTEQLRIYPYHKGRTFTISPIFTPMGQISEPINILNTTLFCLEKSDKIQSTSITYSVALFITRGAIFERFVLLKTIDMTPLN